MILRSESTIRKFLAILLVFFIASCNTNEQEHQYPNSELEEDKTDEEEIVIKEPEIYTASVSSIGDILIHNSVYEDALVEKGKFDFTKMFERVKPYLESADITIANSESIIGGQELGLSSYPQFNSPYEVADALKDAGIDVVTMANNHTLDRGEEAILNATSYWNSLGVTYVGAAASKEDSETIKTITVNNIVFSFLGYTYGTNGLKTAKGKEYLVNYIDEEKLEEDIIKAKSMSDVVIVNLHYGNEYSRMFNDYQEHIAQLASDSGADIIFAHHPHVLQPAKWYDGMNGNKTFVAHSLGNFISAQDELYRQIGAIVQLDVTKTVTFDKNGTENVLIEIGNPKSLITYVKFTNWRDYEIIPMYQLTEDDLVNSQHIYQEMQDHMSQFVPEIIFVEDITSMNNITPSF